MLVLLATCRRNIYKTRKAKCNNFCTRRCSNLHLLLLQRKRTWNQRRSLGTSWQRHFVFYILNKIFYLESSKLIDFIEKNEAGTVRTKVFYCDPYVSNQKGRLEKNHEYIRYIIPKGRSMYKYNQDDINLMLSHINSSKRKILDNKSPIEVFLEKQNDSILELLDIKQIPPDKAILNKNLFTTK